MATIKCKVEECYFNDNAKCLADSILVSYDKDCHEVDCCSNTACETFRKA
ncbi:MAG: DUF1540 domain-containing protein [Firmicutes bacterium]|nr:DUF1540 domain-containing protein [Bacillota bacterium]